MCLQVDEAKAVMVDNIDAVLKRGEKLEQIQEKTEDLMAEVRARFVHV